MKRQISFGQALATVVGSVIGAGVFFKIGVITAQTGSSSMTIFVWVLAGIISIASGLTISEIAASLKINGAIKACQESFDKDTNDNLYLLYGDEEYLKRYYRN